MGRGVVKNMALNGLSVTAFDIDAEKIEDVAQYGVHAGERVVDIAAKSDIFGICVSTAEVVQEIMLGEDGALAQMKPGAVFLDHTTVSVAHVDAMREACEKYNVHYAEAPMTRTPKHADVGQVNILYGGGEDLLERLRPVFDTYAENIFHVGPEGHGIRLKLIHNYIAFANVASFCEGFALAAKDGLDMSKVIDIVSAAGGKSGMMDLYGALTLQRDFTPHMPLTYAQKDVRYYAEWLESHGDEGCTAVIKAYEALSGVTAKLD